MSENPEISKEDWEEYCMHQCQCSTCNRVEDVVNSKKKAELEQLKREIQEAFRFGYGAGALAAGIGNIQDPYEVYKIYQATKKDGEG